MTKSSEKNKKKKNLTLKDQLKTKVDEIKKLTEELTASKQKNINLLAEFDNYQRRTFEEKDRLIRYQGFDIIKDLLPSIDDLDRATKYKDTDNTESMLEAISMINSKIIKVLKKYSISSFESVNIEFDPNLHEALLEQHSEKIKRGNIIEEYEKGYKYDEKIIRHAKVVVSKGQKE